MKDNSVIWQCYSHKKWLELLHDKGLFFSGSVSQDEGTVGVTKNRSKREKLIFSQYINQWTRQSPVENVSLWQQCTGEDYTGVVIRSHVDALLSSFPISLREAFQCDEADEIYFTLDQSKLDEIESEFYSKPLVFEITDEPDEPLIDGIIEFDNNFKIDGDPMNELVVKDNGYVVKHTLSSFIEGVYTHPLASVEYVAKIKQNMTDMGLNISLLKR